MIDRAAGGRFVERMPAVVATCRQRGRDVLAFLTACLLARLVGTPAPSLFSRAVALGRDPRPATAVTGYVKVIPAQALTRSAPAQRNAGNDKTPGELGTCSWAAPLTIILPPGGSLLHAHFQPALAAFRDG